MPAWRMGDRVRLKWEKICGTVTGVDPQGAIVLTDSRLPNCDPEVWIRHDNLEAEPPNA